MSVMRTYPVYPCRHCGTPVVMTLRTMGAPDPDGVRLRQMMQGLQKIAICGPCHRRHLYHEYTKNKDFRLGPTYGYKPQRVIDPRKDEEGYTKN